MVGALICSLQGISQKRVSELTIVYDNFVSSGKDTLNIADTFDGATTTVYIKGYLSRQDMVSALYSSSIIHNAKNNSAVLLREVSRQKILIRLNEQNLKEKNQYLEGMTFEYSDETKEIAGYRCKKATAKLADGASFTVYYTDEIIPENKEYDQYFTKLNGLPLEYELVKGAMKVKYVVSSIHLGPIPASKFEIPSSGYREMKYEERNKSGK